MYAVAVCPMCGFTLTRDSFTHTAIWPPYTGLQSRALPQAEITADHAPGEKETWQPQTGTETNPLERS